MSLASGGIRRRPYFLPRHAKKRVLQAQNFFVAPSGVVFSSWPAVTGAFFRFKAEVLVRRLHERRVAEFEASVSIQETALGRGHRPLSLWCPEACGCHCGDEDCPLTCPERNDKEPPCPWYPPRPPQKKERGEARYRSITHERRSRRGAA